MEWVKDYWYMILIGLVVAMYLFGNRRGKGEVGEEHSHDHAEHTKEKAGKSGHGCCH